MAVRPRTAVIAAAKNAEAQPIAKKFMIAQVVIGISLREEMSWSRTDSLGCPSFPFVLIRGIGNNASNVSKVDIDLLFSCFYPFLGTLVDHYLVDEGSQNLRC